MSKSKNSLISSLKAYWFSHKSPDIFFGIYHRIKKIIDRKKLSDIIKKDAFLKNLDKETKDIWKKRINDVKNCPDIVAIPKEPLAGEFKDGNFIMYNGIKIDPLSYYSFPMLKLLIENDGIHEPQEEKVFHEVLKSIKKIKTNPTMMELGAFWSFYSLCFKKEFPEGTNYMIEPNKLNMYNGKYNFKLNGYDGHFIQGYLGENYHPQKNILSIDSIMESQNIQFLDILHSDIQGFEYDMLLGAVKTIKSNKIGYAFISTHSNELHEKCRNLLANNFGFTVVSEANLDQSYSWDGILVMKAPHYPGISRVSISDKLKDYK